MRVSQNNPYGPSELVKKAMKAPYLEKEEEATLIKAFKEKDDQDALHQLIHAHMRLVISMAYKFRSYGLPLNDLIQEGHIGLLEAASRFERAHEVRFATYAGWWIRASLQDYVLRNWSIVRGGTSSAQKKLFFNLRRLRAQISQGHNDLPASLLHQQIARVVGVSVHDVAVMDARLSGSDYALDAPVSDDGDEGQSSRMDFLMCDQPLADDLLGNMMAQEHSSYLLKKAIAQLNEREKIIIQERRLQEKGATLEDLGKKLQLSKERIRQIEVGALAKLRDLLKGESFILDLSFYQS